MNLLRSKITKTGRHDVQKFIRYRLKSKITGDLKRSRIFNEADLQSVVYLHIRRYLSRDKRWKILNQQYISKMWGKRKTINFFPDIVLAIKKPRISIELKERKTVRKNRVMNDAKKLYKLKKQGVIRRGFIIYLYQNKRKKNESSLEKDANTWIRKYHRYVHCILINAYEHIPKTKQDKWNKLWNKSTHYRI